MENENIVIKGDSKSGVANACSRILLIVESSRSKMDQTHFISIPLNSKDMQEAQMTFRKDVIELIHEKKSEKSHFTNNSHSVIDDSIFQTPSLLHLTIGTLSLMGKCAIRKPLNFAVFSFLLELSIYNAGFILVYQKVAFQTFLLNGTICKSIHLI